MSSKSTLTLVATAALLLTACAQKAAEPAAEAPAGTDAAPAAAAPGASPAAPAGSNSTDESQGGGEKIEPAP
jgi:hypothetical protein